MKKNNHPIENVDGEHVLLGMGFLTAPKINNQT